MKIIGPTNFSASPTDKNIDEKLQDVSKMYEKQFLREMMKAMRSTVTQSELLPVSQGEKIYREELDNEYAEKWGDAGGIGLSNMIFDQLKQKFGSKGGVEDKGLKPIHSFSLTSPRTSHSSEGNADMMANQLFLKVSAAATKQGELANPLPGRVIEKTETAMAAGVPVTHLAIDHGPLKSKWTFQGKSTLEAGDEIEAENSVGRLAGDAQEFLVHWSKS